jgi:tetratricopeptide (TPR) repeat protein
LRLAEKAKTGSGRSVLLSIAGAALSNDGSLNEGAKACDRAIAADPKQPAGHMCAFVNRQKRGDMAEAEKILLACVEQNPNFVGAYLALENFYEQKSRNADAIAVLEKVLAIQPLAAVFHTVLTPLPMAANEVYYRVAVRLSRLYLDAGDSAKALQAAARAQAFGGPGREVREIVARIAMKNGEYAKAVRALEPLAKNQPSAEERILLAQAYSGIGQPARAKRQLDAVLNGPQSPLRTEAQKMLARIAR